MKNTTYNVRFGLIFLLIASAAFSRLIPHPQNVAPIAAMALLGVAYFSNKYHVFIVPVLAMWLSDLAINNILYHRYFDHFVWFYPGFYWTYLAFVLIGSGAILLLKKVSVKTILPASLLASITFFLVSNFGVWASGIMYPKDVNGLIACYSAGIPFFKNTLIGDLFYCGILFGIFEIAKKKYPALQIQNSINH